MHLNDFQWVARDVGRHTTARLAQKVYLADGDVVDLVRSEWNRRLVASGVPSTRLWAREGTAGANVTSGAYPASVLADMRLEPTIRPQK